MVIRAGDLSIRCIVMGDFATNCYVLTRGEAGSRSAPPDADGGSATPASPCWIVDPGIGPAPLLEKLDRLGLSPERILLTHGHADHIAGVAAVKQAWPSAILTVPRTDEHMLCDPAANLSLPFGLSIIVPPADETVQPGDELAMGPRAWRVLDTSGHTPGGVTYYCRDAAVAITGDALFAGSIGRTDLPGASESRLLRNIRDNLLTLSDETRVLPGHGPMTTIGDERRSNPFVP